ncbi:MAG: zinc-binding dehydrogenase [Bacillati bacterium ANGP1]|uniref:Zinc-binding dehydrogenase n=1 Tax=Candidatus Segetimicrobium genomatis TaxID=2569760 RepID=A0A537LS04_9BACT|nr:MAG: zinc-binding dehydrogenase [Terrabacteria group bacterium ANGP1]
MLMAWHLIGEERTMNGRVAVLREYSGEFELREYPVPEVEPGAILVKLTRAGICGSDLHIWRGEMKDVYGGTPKDLTFGHEMCGRVERLGAGISTDSMNRRCPICLQDELGSCPRKPRPSRVAGTPPYFNNAYGDYYYLRPNHYVFKIPAEISDDVAAPVNCALSQVVYGLQRAGLRFGHTAVIQGAGGLGINAVGVARDMGADTIIVFDRFPARLELARAFGADHALSLTDLRTPEERIEAVMALTGGFGADVVADLVGYPQVIPEGLRMLRSGGCYLEVGNITPGNVFSYDASQLVRSNARLVATSNYSPWAIPQALAFIERNARRLPFERIVSHTFPLERISEGFRQAEWLQRGGDPLRISRAAVSM